MSKPQQASSSGATSGLLGSLSTHIETETKQLRERKYRVQSEKQGMMAKWLYKIFIIWSQGSEIVILRCLSKWFKKSASMNLIVVAQGLLKWEPITPDEGAQFLLLFGCVNFPFELASKSTYLDRDYGLLAMRTFLSSLYLLAPNTYIFNSK